MTVKCTNPNCNKEQEYNEEKRFCEMCGTKLPQTKQCIKCNKELPLEANFCSFCGTNQNEAISKSQSTGFYMGNDNIIGGDFTVVGKKEETHIAGNATIVKNEDETKHVKVCHICGSHKTVLEVHDCPECKKFTCNSCFNKEYKMCNGCATNKISENEKAYKEKLVQFLEDGIIDKNERKELDDLKQKYMISDETSLRLENSLKKNINIETLLTTIEKSNLENSYEIFYDEGDVVEAYNLLKPLYDKYPNEEKVLEIFLPVLLKKDINEAKTVVTNSSIDSFSVFLLKTQIALEENRLDDAERNLLQAKKYANNNIVKYFEILLYVKISRKTQDRKYLKKAHEIFETMDESKNKLETSYKAKASIDVKSTFHYLTKSYCIEHNLYKFLLLEPLEVTVGIGCVFETIQSAIDSVPEGSIIHVQTGMYKENLIVNKNVKILGISENIKEKSSKELPIVVSDKEIGCKIESNAKIEGIVFTNNENLEFTSIDEYISTEKELFDDGIDETCCFSIKADVTLSNIAILDCKCNGVIVDSCNPKLEKLIVNNCFRGILLFNNSIGLYQNCEISETVKVGFLVKEKSNPQVIGCTIHDIPDNSGIAIYDESTGTYENCDISNTKYEGIYVGNKSNPHVIGCTIHDILDDSGINIRGESSGTYENCDILNTKYAGIAVSNKSNPRVIGCKIHDIPENTGIGILEEATGIYENCDISETKYAGIYVGEKSNPHIIGCNIHDILENAGIWISEEATGIYENCDISKTGLAGIDIREKSNPHIIGCKIHYIPGANGIVIEGESIGTYENCDISETKYAGIYVGEKSNPHIIGCNIHDILENAGISILGEATGKYENCDISKTGLAGMCVFDIGNPHVIGCKISDILEAQGIIIQDNATGKFENCNIFKTGKASILVENKANPYIISCNISDSSGISIINEATGTYENCDISNTSLSGINIGDKSNPYIISCNIHNLTGRGIIIQDNATGKFENCEIFDIKHQGIYVDGNANPHLLGCKIFNISDSCGIIIFGDATGTYKNCDISMVQRGVHVSNNADPFVSSCNIHDISNYGIYIDDKANGIYRDCIIHNAQFSIKKTRKAKIINCRT